jgi:hypothetical protein
MRGVLGVRRTREGVFGGEEDTERGFWGEEDTEGGLGVMRKREEENEGS